TEALAFRGEASALVIGQSEAAPFQLPLEDPILRHEVLDDVLLVAIDPSGEDHEQHLQRVNIGHHESILPRPHLALCIGWGSAEYSDLTPSKRTGSNGSTSTSSTRVWRSYPHLCTSPIRTESSATRHTRSTCPVLCILPSAGRPVLTPR